MTHGAIVHEESERVLMAGCIAVVDCCFENLRNANTAATLTWTHARIERTPARGDHRNYRPVSNAIVVPLSSRLLELASLDVK